MILELRSRNQYILHMETVLPIVSCLQLNQEEYPSFEQAKVINPRWGKCCSSGGIRLREINCYTIFYISLALIERMLNNTTVFYASLALLEHIVAD